MKNTIVLIGLMLLSMAGFSQMTKSDVGAYLTRNNIAQGVEVAVYSNSSSSKIDSKIDKITEMESGLSIVFIKEEGNFEFFVPYSNISYMMMKMNSFGGKERYLELGIKN